MLNPGVKDNFVKPTAKYGVVPVKAPIGKVWVYSAGLFGGVVTGTPAKGLLHRTTPVLMLVG